MAQKISSSDFTHLDKEGKAKMVDVSTKEATQRRAVASAKILASCEVIKRLKEMSVAKGDVIAIARVAGIQAAKKTSELIPLCHPLSLGSVSLDFELEESAADSKMGQIIVSSVIETFDKTGVEMEALTACSVAALTIYDMCKSLDRSMQITDIKLVEKTGGKSGTYKSEPN